MNPTIAQQLVKYHHADLAAEAAAARLAASVKAGSRETGGTAGTRRLVVLVAGLITSLVR